jgi:DNA polymerase-3 subunit delta'
MMMFSVFRFGGLLAGSHPPSRAPGDHRARAACVTFVFVLLQDIAGQPRAIAVLRRALAGGHLAHAYLFEGPPGVGKRQAAVGVAMALDCEPSPGEACGRCESCRRIAAGLHPDVITVISDGPQIVMEQAQQIVGLGQQRPHEARARVIIIEDADRLNASASNCLLKTLEEPLRGTHIVLVTAAPDRLLPTIRSRTQRVRFDRISEAAMLELGAARGVGRERTQVAAVLADGSMARFLALLSPPEADPNATPGAATEDPTVAIARTLRHAAAGRGIGPILDAAGELGNKEAKDRLPDGLALLARAYRDAMVTAGGAPELSVLTGDGATELAFPPSLGLAQLGRALTVIVEAETALAGNVNATMALERMLLGLRREERLRP